MKPLSAIHAFYHMKCLKDGLTREKAAEFFGCSWQFIFAVLTYKRPMPEWMVKKMAEFLTLDERIVGLAFGYYPKEWTKLCQDTPEVAFKGIQTMLKTLKPASEMSLGETRGKTRRVG